MQTFHSSVAWFLAARDARASRGVTLEVAIEPVVDVHIFIVRPRAVAAERSALRTPITARTDSYGLSPYKCMGNVWWELTFVYHGERTIAIAPRGA